MNKNFLKLIEKITRQEIERNAFGWPPLCTGIYHQPKKPKIKIKK